MSEGTQQFVVVAVVVLVFGAVSAVWRRWRRGKELGAYGELSRRLGWQHIPSAVNGEADRFLGDAPFPGGSRTAVTVTDYCHGTYRGQQVATFEAAFVTRSAPDGDVGGPGDSDSQRSSFAVWAVQLHHPTAEFTVQRTGALRRALGSGDDVRIGHDAFDEQFTVRTLQHTAVAEVLHGALADFLLADPRAKDFPLRFTGTEVITWGRGDQTPERIEPALDFLTEVARRVTHAPPQPSQGAGQYGVGVRKAVVASPTEQFIASVEEQLTLSGAPFRVVPTASRFDIVPDLADPRWRGLASARLWQVTPNAEKRTFSLTAVQHRVNDDGSLGGVSSRSTVGSRAVERATQSDPATTDATSKDFGVAVVARVAAEAGWRTSGDWVGPVAISAAVVGALGAVAAVIALLLTP
ncbi:hypothetical protein [Streptomyces sp. WG-D5]